MNMTPINLNEGAAVLVMLRTSAAWGERFDAPTKNNRVAVDLFAELIEVALSMDGHSAGKVARCGDWGTCVFIAPVRPDCEEVAKVVVEKVIAKSAFAEHATVATFGAGGFKKTPAWTLDELNEFVSVFGAVVDTAGRQLQAEIVEHNKKFDGLHKRIDDAMREVRAQRDEGEGWKRGGDDDGNGGGAATT